MTTQGRVGVSRVMTVHASAGSTVGARRYPTSHQSWANTTQAVFAAAGVSYDTGGFTTGQADGKFKVPSSGFYLVTAGEQFSGLPAAGTDSEFYIEIDVNNSAVFDEWRVYGSTGNVGVLPSITIAKVLKLSAGDIVHVELYQTTGSTRTGSSGDYFGIDVVSL